MPCPLDFARAANFNFRQWFTCVVFSYDLFDLLDAVLQDLNLPSDQCF